MVDKDTDTPNFAWRSSHNSSRYRSGVLLILLKRCYIVQVRISKQWRNKQYLNVLILKCIVKGCFFTLWAFDATRLLEMSENVMDFLNADICESGYFLRRHHSTKADDSPLNGFMNSLTLSHGGGEIASWKYQLRPIMVRYAAVQPNHTFDIQPWLQLSQKLVCICTIERRIYIYKFGPYNTFKSFIKSVQLWSMR